MAPWIPALIVVLGGAADHITTKQALRRGGVESGVIYRSHYNPKLKLATTVAAAGAAYALTRKDAAVGVTFAVSVTAVQVTVSWRNRGKAR